MVVNIALVQENGQAEQRIESALRNPKYAWRCVKHVAKETGLTEFVVSETLERWVKENKVRTREVPGADGLVMYGLRERLSVI